MLAVSEKRAGVFKAPLGTKRVWLLPLVLAMLSTPSQAFEPVGEMSGTGQVVDGDGIAIRGIEVRLQGIAAPEDNAHNVAPGGPESTANLRHVAEGQHVRCLLDGTTTRGRPVGVCYVGDLEVNHYQVRTGHARDCPRFSGGRYRNAEAQARSDGRDLSRIYRLPGYCD